MSLMMPAMPPGVVYSLPANVYFLSVSRSHFPLRYAISVSDASLSPDAMNTRKRRPSAPFMPAMARSMPSMLLWKGVIMSLPDQGRYIITVCTNFASGFSSGVSS